MTLAEVCPSIRDIAKTFTPELMAIEAQEWRRSWGVIFCTFARFTAPAHVPPTVTSWYNFAAKGDLVAARLDIGPYFPPTPSRTVTPISHIVDTGSKTHDIVHYLTKPSCGQAVFEALI